jgi:hypothetical protein
LTEFREGIDEEHPNYHDEESEGEDKIPVRAKNS